ncbi:mannose-1-phosphate guanylyltransferase, partial [Ruminococcaceae bacterium FB2012]
MNHYGVIMAGGGGTRFWPLSRQKKPKQLLNLSGSDLMVNEAVERMAEVIGKSNIFIVTGELQTADMLVATAGKVFPRNILSEPAARNTATCIGYSAMEILKKYGDGVMVITPADHYIEDVSALTDVLKTAILAAEQQDKLITIGITPTFPSTAFGYIRCGSEETGNIKPVLGFREKPDEAAASEYVASGKYLWNSGMFIWKASLILEKIKEYAPDIYAELEKIGNAMNTPEEQEVLHDVYPNIRKMSIDYAVMEPSASRGDVLVLPCDCGWNDVGAWDTMSVLHEKDENGNVLVGDVTAIDAEGSVLYS